MRRLALLLPLLLLAGTSSAQVDDAKRRLLQFGYEQPMSGPAPFSGYAFYYLNEPDFLRKGSVLRLAVAPLYLDGEYGVKGALGQDTDLGLGLSGGGFAQSHAEIRAGRLYRDESFTGHGGGASVALYHLFNRGELIPLTGILRAGVQHATYEPQRETDPRFELPLSHTTLLARGGLRYGGEEPLMDPLEALEVSGWYEGRVRDRSDPYGFSDERALRTASHFAWGRALLTYTPKETGRRLHAGLAAGGSLNADRLDAYGLGGLLPMSEEFPLQLPGYYARELSARHFVLLDARCGVPLDARRIFSASVFAASALVDYVPGMEQPGRSHTGLGAGLEFTAPDRDWSSTLNYGYGVDAIRSGRRGAHSIALTIQYDFEAAPQKPVKPARPGKPQGLRWFHR